MGFVRFLNAYGVILGSRIKGASREYHDIPTFFGIGCLPAWLGCSSKKT